jgi:hypothetical protein
MFGLWDMVIVIVYGQYQLVCFKVEFFGYIVIQYGLMLIDMRKSVTAAFTNKSKAVLLHAMETLGGRGGIAPTHSRPRH